MLYIFSLTFLLLLCTIMFIVYLSTEKERKQLERKLAEMQELLDKLQGGKNE